MKDKVMPKVNVIWQHHETYSILRKETTDLSGVFDFLLQPPMIIKNCLPCSLNIEIVEKKK
jgi:hypothetical protein